MLEKIFDPIFLVQALVSAIIVWLFFEIVKIAYSFLSSILGKYNKNWERETLMFEQIQSQIMLSEGDRKTQCYLLCIYGALSRAFQGMIYLCAGLLVSGISEPLSMVAYGFCIFYLFKATKAVFLEVSDGKTIDDHKNRVKEIEDELEQLEK